MDPFYYPYYRRIYSKDIYIDDSKIQNKLSKLKKLHKELIGQKLAEAIAKGNEKYSKSEIKNLKVLLINEGSKAPSEDRKHPKIFRHPVITPLEKGIRVGAYLRLVSQNGSHNASVTTM